MKNPYIFDIIFAVVLAFMYWQGKRRGAFRVLSGMFGTLIAWLGASALSTSVMPVTVKLMTPFAESAVEKAAGSMGLSEILGVSIPAGTGTSDLAGQVLLSGLTDQLSAIADKLGISGTFSGVLSGAAPVETVTPADLLTRAMVEKAAPVITFFVLFVAIKAVLAFAVRIGSADWPIIGAVNRLAGGALGLAGGAVIVVALCAGIFVFGSTEPEGITSSVLLAQSFTGRLLAGFFGR